MGHKETTAMLYALWDGNAPLTSLHIWALSLSLCLFLYMSSLSIFLCLFLYMSSVSLQLFLSWAFSLLLHFFYFFSGLLLFRRSLSLCLFRFISAISLSFFLWALPLFFFSSISLSFYELNLSFFLLMSSLSASFFYSVVNPDLDQKESHFKFLQKPVINNKHI